MPASSRTRRRPEINVVPLIDVLVVLIFFFLVSMQFRNQNTLNLVLPKIETAGENKLQEQLEIAITEDGLFYLNGTPVDENELSQGLATAGAVGLQVPVVIIADETSALKYVTRVMDLCRKNGLEQIRLQSR